MKILENKVAVITGDTRGLGLGIAQTYAAEGAAVVIAGRSQTTVDNALTEFQSSGGRRSSPSAPTGCFVPSRLRSRNDH